MAEPPQSDKPDSPYQIAQKQRMHWRGGERSKSISIYFSFFSLELSLLIPLIFSEPNRLQIFALMRGCAFASNFISCESGARAAPETPLCESLQRCVKGKHVLHSESQGSLSLLISVMKCFLSPALRIQASALPQTNLSRGSAHVEQHHRGRAPLSKGCFFLRAPLWVLLVWFADNSRVGEHVVHVCSIYPLIRLQGSALKHAL